MLLLLVTELTTWLSGISQKGPTAIAVLGAIAFTAACIPRIEKYYADRQMRRATLSGLVRGSQRGRLPKLSHIEMVHLGVHDASPANIGLIEYVPRRRIDARLVRVLQIETAVLVYGPSAAGKSRSLCESARTLFGERPVIVPVDGKALGLVLDKNIDVDGAILWLDDLDKYLVDGLTIDTVRRALDNGVSKVVGTIRSRAEEFIKVGDADGKRRGWDALSLFANGRVEVTREFDHEDMPTLRKGLAGLPDILAAVQSGLGLAEFLSAGPELLRYLHTGEPDVAGRAIVAALADWSGLGLLRPMPMNYLQTVWDEYLDDRAEPYSFENGIIWVTAEISTAGMALVKRTGAGLKLHDYVADEVLSNGKPLTPPTVVDGLLTQLNFNDDEHAIVGSNAYFVHGDLDLALSALRWGVASGSAQAREVLTSVLSLAGRHDELEHFLHKAAMEGDMKAAERLGGLLVVSGRHDSAERWLRRAWRLQAPETARQLSWIYHERGRFKDCLKWLKRALEAGDESAAEAIGDFYEGHARPGLAETVWEEAAAVGSSTALNNLGGYSWRRQDVLEAEARWLEAADNGVSDASFNLALLLYASGRLEEAAYWFDAAWAGGQVCAAVGLGMVFFGQGDHLRAESWWIKAARHGFFDAIHSLAVMFLSDGNIEKAIHWMRRGEAQHGPSCLYRHVGEAIARQEAPKRAVPILAEGAKRGDLEAFKLVESLHPELCGSAYLADLWTTASKANQRLTLQSTVVIEHPCAEGAHSSYRLGLNGIRHAQRGGLKVGEEAICTYLLMTVIHR